MHESKPPSDALVFFGATGDLAYKKIFPALQSLTRRGRLNVPVIGVLSRTVGARNRQASPEIFSLRPEKSTCRRSSDVGRGLEGSS